MHAPSRSTNRIVAGCTQGTHVHVPFCFNRSCLTPPVSINRGAVLVLLIQSVIASIQPDVTRHAPARRSTHTAEECTPITAAEMVRPGDSPGN